MDTDRIDQHTSDESAEIVVILALRVNELMGSEGFEPPID